jgi:hypothetical protein
LLVHEHAETKGLPTSGLTPNLAFPYYIFGVVVGIADPLVEQRIACLLNYLASVAGKPHTEEIKDSPQGRLILRVIV